MEGWDKKNGPGKGQGEGEQRVGEKKMKKKVRKRKMNGGSDVGRMGTLYYGVA